MQDIDKIFESEFQSHEQQIQDLISSINFKNTESINFDSIKEQIMNITGCIPSVTPKWEIVKSANEDLLLDGSNKIVEKIASIDIVYFDTNGVPKPLKFIV